MFMLSIIHNLKYLRREYKKYKNVYDSSSDETKEYLDSPNNLLDRKIENAVNFINRNFGLCGLPINTYILGKYIEGKIGAEELKSYLEKLEQNIAQIFKDNIVSSEGSITIINKVSHNFSVNIIVSVYLSYKKYDVALYPYTKKSDDFIFYPVNASGRLTIKDLGDTICIEDYLRP